jgi:hypothetical protein
VRAKRVVVYDPDGVNPYGRELAAQLAEAGYAVTAVVAADAEWRPAGVRTLAVLPYNRGGAGGTARQAFRLLRGLVVVKWLSLTRRADWIVVWTRTRVDDRLLAAVALLHPVHVVVHNPGLRDVRAHGALRRRARTLVTHAHAEGSTVCAHPLYVHWLRWAAPPAPAPHDTLRLLLLGHRRPDKGDDVLPSLLAALPDDVRRRVEVVVCGKGRAPALTGVAVDDRTSPDFVPDRVLARALVSCDALLAPYTGATQSGTVALAVTAGLPVLGFASGALADLVPDLAPEGHVAALAERIARGALTPPPRDEGAAVRDWQRVLR